MKILLALILSLAVSGISYCGECASTGWFGDVGIGYNLDNPDNGQDFEGGREIAILGLGYEFDCHEIGYSHVSHYLRGWPGERWFSWSGDEEQIDMLYYKRRIKW